jgi:GNAT superfamily N-acetyltransferase
VTPDLLIRKTSELSAEEREQLHELFLECFPPELEDGSVYADDDWHLMAKVDGRVVSRVGVVDRVVEAGGHELRIAGVGGVGTRTEWRCRGLARLLVEGVGDWMRGDFGADFGLLFCNDVMAKFYAKSGWQRIIAPVWSDQPSGRRLEDGVTMFLPSRRAVWPDGTVDIRGLPF